MIRILWTTVLAWLAAAAGAADFIALRGEASAAPENTMAAFRLAWKTGADGVACDVRLSRDGRLVLAREDDLKGLAGKSVRVSQSSWKELSLLDIGGERLALLEELLAELPEGKEVLIVLAADSRELADKAGKVIAGAGLDDRQVILASPFEAVVRRAVEVSPYSKTLLIADSAGGKALADAAKKSFADGLLLPGTKNWPADAVAAWRKAGLILAADGVEKAADAVRAVGNGAQLILSTRAGALKKETGS